MKNFSNLVRKYWDFVKTNSSIFQRNSGLISKFSVLTFGKY